MSIDELKKTKDTSLSLNAILCSNAGFEIASFEGDVYVDVPSLVFGFAEAFHAGCMIGLELPTREQAGTWGVLERNNVAAEDIAKRIAKIKRDRRSTFVFVTHKSLGWSQTAKVFSHKSYWLANVRRTHSRTEAWYIAGEVYLMACGPVEGRYCAARFVLLARNPEPQP